jgi:hypothetical protein
MAGHHRPFRLDPAGSVTNETKMKRIAAHSEAVRTLPVKAEPARYML